MAETTLTLAFELAALRRLAHPGGAVGEAREWSEYVGVVSEKPAHAVNKFTRDHRIQHDFEPGPESRRETLTAMADHFDTDRCVFVGTTDGDAGLAADVGWEYQSVAEAADAAGWELSGPATDADAVRAEDDRDDWP